MDLNLIIHFDFVIPVCLFWRLLARQGGQAEILINRLIGEYIKKVRLIAITDFIHLSICVSIYLSIYLSQTMICIKSALYLHLKSANWVLNMVLSTCKLEAICTKGCISSDSASWVGKGCVVAIST